MQLSRGDIIHFYDLETTPSKNKFMVVVGIHENELHLATVYINSNINLKALPIEMQALNILIKKKDYPFLSHDSYVDCSKITLRNIEELNALFTTNDISIHGTLNKQDLGQIILNLISNRTIKGKDKRRLGFFNN